MEYAHALIDWLEPFHNHCRPPPAVVLAEAAKQTELKTGHPLKGIDIPPMNGNGYHKKSEEPPTIQEAPEVVIKYFDGKLPDRFGKRTYGRCCFIQLPSHDSSKLSQSHRRVNCFMWPLLPKKYLSRCPRVYGVLTSSAGLSSSSDGNTALQKSNSGKSSQARQCKLIFVALLYQLR